VKEEEGTEKNTGATF